MSKRKSVFSGKKNQYFCLREGFLHSAHTTYLLEVYSEEELPNAIKAALAFEHVTAERSRNRETQRLMPCGH